jgi:hypothetical protein
MNQEKMEQLNLQSQKLTIDYLSFNIPGFFQKDYLRKVALYLFESFGFNATFKREQTKIHMKLILSIMITIQK